MMRHRHRYLSKTPSSLGPKRLSIWRCRCLIARILHQIRATLCDITQEHCVIWGTDAHLKLSRDLRLRKHYTDGIVVPGRERCGVGALAGPNSDVKVVVCTRPARVCVWTDPYTDRIVDVTNREGVITRLLREDVAAMVEDEVVREEDGRGTIDGDDLIDHWLINTADRVRNRCVDRRSSLVVLKSFERLAKARLSFVIERV